MNPIPLLAPVNTLVNFADTFPTELVTKSIDYYSAAVESVHSGYSDAIILHVACFDTKVNKADPSLNDTFARYKKSDWKYVLITTYHESNKIVSLLLKRKNKYADAVVVERHTCYAGDFDIKEKLHKIHTELSPVTEEFKYK